MGSTDLSFSVKVIWLQLRLICASLSCLYGQNFEAIFYLSLVSGDTCLVRFSTAQKEG